MQITQAASTSATRRNDASRGQLLCRVRAEFHEMPCLRLTRKQAERLFGLRQDVCERVLATLISEHTLTRGFDGRYGIRDSVAGVGLRP